MPKFAEFDAGSGKLQPSEAGAEGLARAGTAVARSARVQAEATRQEGAMFRQGIDSIGSAVSGLTERAQAHTDAMAETDADAQMIASTVAAKGVVTEGGTPTTADGEPITDSVGVGGDKSLPQDAKVPSPDTFAVVADNAITQHAQAGQSFLDKLTGQGVSQKAQDRIAEKQQKHQAELQIHSMAVANEVATTHVVHQTDSVLRGLLSDTNEHPENLDVNLAHGADTFATLRSHGTGDAAKGLEVAATKGQEAYREQAVKAAYEGVARKGGDANIAEAIKIMDNHSNDVKDRQAGLNEINRLANQQNMNLERQQRQEEREQAIKIDGAAATAYEGSKLPANDPKNVKDPYAEVRKQFHGNDLIAAEKEIKLLQQNETMPVDKSTSDSTEMDIQKRIDDGSLLKADAEKEIKAAWDNRQIDRQGAQRAIRAAAQSETSDGKFIKEQRTAFIKQYEAVFNGPKMASGFFNSEEGAGKARLDAIKLENTLDASGKPLGRSIYDQDSPNYIGRKADGTPSQFMLDHKMGMQNKINQGLDNAGIAKPGASAPAAAGAKDDLGRIGGPNAPPVTMPMSMSLLTADGRAASITQMIKTYQPGTKVNAPNGTTYTIPPAGTTFQVEGKSYTVPGQAVLKGNPPPVSANPNAPKKMNYSPDAGVPAPSANPAAPAGVTGEVTGNAMGSVGGMTHSVTGNASFDRVMPKIFKDEGGRTFDSGGDTRFGITARDHPGVSLNNLTKAKAQEIYKTQYWDKMNIDSLPENMKHTVMDAAVNEGVGKARSMLAKSGNDPHAFNELRRDHYYSLVDHNPTKYARYLKGWMNRLNRVEAETTQTVGA